ncbi:MAG: FTR1 family iron permease [Candidatus Bathyarchaeia archaeon]
MISQFLIILREGFEAAFTVSIVLAYLKKIGKRSLYRYVWYGAVVAIALSLVIGHSTWLVYGVLPKPFQALFEGTAAWLAMAVLTYMIHWMGSKGREIREDVRRKVKAAETHGTAIGLSALAFLIVFREGVESVLFLLPFLVKDLTATLLGSASGILAAAIFAYAVFTAGAKMSVRKFFYVTSILLILLAGGLAGYGTHEIIEYLEHSGIDLDWLASEAYALPVPQENPLHDKSIVGSILSVFFGYTVKAEWARIMVHLSYLVIALPATIRMYLRKDQQ